MLRVTVDTNVLTGDLQRIREACEGLDVEIKQTTVTNQERGIQLPDPAEVAETGVYDESVYDSGAIYAAEPVPETFVLDESRLNEGVLGGDDSPMEAILSIISNRSFPPPGRRDTLKPGERRQLRDAMILEAHAREGRDVLVSNDTTAFVGRDGEKRQALEALCATRILTVNEFCGAVRDLVRHA